MYGDINNAIWRHTVVENQLNITKLDTYILITHAKMMSISYSAENILSVKRNYYDIKCYKFIALKVCHLPVHDPRTSTFLMTTFFF